MDNDINNTKSHSYNTIAELFGAEKNVCVQNDLRKSATFCDAKIVLEDGGCLPIHRVVLCSATEYFQWVSKTNSHFKFHWFYASNDFYCDKNNHSNEMEFIQIIPANCSCHRWVRSKTTTISSNMFEPELWNVSLILPTRTIVISTKRIWANC